MPILEVIEYLEPGSNVEGVAINSYCLGRLQACQTYSHRHGRFKGRGCLQSINSEALLGSHTPLPRIPPPQFGSLPLGKPKMGIREDCQQITMEAGLSRNPGNKSVACSKEVVTDVDCRRYAPLNMDRRPAVPNLILVFDVIVDQRCLMEDFDRHCGHASCLSVNCGGLAYQLVSKVDTEGVVCSKCHKWPQVFPSSRKKFSRQLGGDLERVGLGICLLRGANEGAKSLAQTVVISEAHDRLLLKKLGRFAK